ncbi:unnamed protein product [Oikopleura dioica]|uniref:Claudin n=1 Tax=Oikopleura dioica TaxID=34765 RepID=E4WRL0_OIKDI|nr:unnamed protein product [Oikopleura dioica]
MDVPLGWNKGKSLTLGATGVILGLAGSICAYIAFLARNWLTVVGGEIIEEGEQGIATNLLESEERPDAGTYGLWWVSTDEVALTLSKRFYNCNAIPFSVCMYTRAGLFSACVLIVPAMLLAFLAAAVLVSRGQLQTTGTLARASSGMFLLSFVGCTAGMLTFTLQQSVCISTCPPEHEYYPLVFNNEATLGYAFYLGWISSGLLLMAASALLALSCEAQTQISHCNSAFNMAIENPMMRAGPQIGESQMLTEYSGKV